LQPTLTKKTNIVEASKRLISNEIISTLINLSGRQRMLSQRIVLNALLAAQKQPNALKVAEEALHLFSNTHTILVHGDREYPGIFFEELHKAYFGPAESEKYIQSFILLAEQVITACKNNTAELSRLIVNLGDMATNIVSLLNEVTLAYEHESKRRTAVRNKQQLELMSSIQKIAKEARIVSFNAQVIAARAGDSGREFSVVASVLTDITEKMDNLAVAAMATAES
jgi:hypothetical protein